MREALRPDKLEYCIEPEQHCTNCAFVLLYKREILFLCGDEGTKEYIRWKPNLRLFCMVLEHVLYPVGYFVFLHVHQLALWFDVEHS